MIKLNIQLVSRCYTLFSLLRKYIFNWLIITTNKYCSGGRAALKTSTFRYKKRKRLVEKPEKLHSINLFFFYFDLWFKSVKWCLRAESNCRHKDFQSFALPTELPRQEQVAVRTGLEPAISSVTD